jgi:hypothetical protein
MGESKQVVVPLHSARDAGIKATLEEALAEHADFVGVLVVGLVEDEAGAQAIRTYYAGFNRLERQGILIEAQDLVL